MFIAERRQDVSAPVERHVFSRFDVHSAPNGAGQIRGARGYKHFAPPEQEPQNNKKELLCKAVAHGSTFTFPESEPRAIPTSVTL